MRAPSIFRPGIGPAELTAAAAMLEPFLPSVGLGGGLVGIGSPWAQSGSLAPLVWSDALGMTPFRPVTRAEAMRVPAVARARHIVCGTIARTDLGAYRGDDRLSSTDEPSWIRATDGPLSPFHRMLWTLDDVFFYGWSLWRRTVNSQDTGFPLRMARVPIGQWDLERETGRVLIYKPGPNGLPTLQPANLSEVVLIPGPHEGLLVDGADSVRHAADLQRAAHSTARHPSAYLGLKQTSGTALKRRSDDPDEVTVETVLADWRAARLNPDGGGVAWLGGVEPHEFGTFDAHLVVDGRNAANVDVARHASIPADLIDAQISESSLHYSTSRDNDRRTIDYGLGLYMSSVSGALTQDTVTPRGQSIAFDLERWLQGEGSVPGQPAPTPTPGTPPAAGIPAPITTGETPQ